MIIPVLGFRSDDKATIISGVLSMVGGFAGAIGAYFVASNQMNKQFDYEKKKEARQRKEVIEQILKNLRLLNKEALSFTKDFKKELAKPYNTERSLKFKFCEDDFRWIVDKIDSVNQELLQEDYSLDYLRFSRELNNLYLDIVALNSLPEEQKEHNLPVIELVVSARERNFEEFEKYVKVAIKDIRNQIENLK